MRIAIAHGSAEGTRALALMLGREPGHELGWTARSGAEALRKLAEQPPELLLLDVCLAGPSSVEITRQVLSRTACGVLLVADRPQVRMSDIYEAMGLGALDVVTPPAFTDAGELIGWEALRSKLRTVSRMLASSDAQSPLGVSGLRKPGQVRTKLVAIGASTGGPQALYRILSELPRELGAACVIAQHVDSEFCAGLASWLQQGTTMHVKLATAGCFPAAGTALLAASNDHLVLTASGSFAYTEEPRQLPYRPSVDVLLQSLAENWSTPGVAVLLTGMGRDGALGLKQLRQAGWRTIAQDEATSIVFGMPKAAIQLDAADQVLPLDGIATAIARACR